MDDKEKKIGFTLGFIGWSNVAFMWLGSILGFILYHMLKFIFLAEEKIQDYVLITYIVVYLASWVIYLNFEEASGYLRLIFRYIRLILRYIRLVFESTISIGEQGNVNRSLLMIIGLFLLILAVIVLGTILVLK